MSAAGGGGGPGLNAWKALLDFSTRHTEPESNPDVKPMSKGAMTALTPSPAPHSYSFPLCIFPQRMLPF